MASAKVNLDNAPSGHAYLPVFEDAVSIQSAISDVCEMMLHRRIEPKEASILLYAMQVASINMAHLNGKKAQRTQKAQKKNPPGNSEPSAPSSTAPSTANEAPATSDPTIPSEPARNHSGMRAKAPGRRGTTGI